MANRQICCWLFWLPGQLSNVTSRKYPRNVTRAGQFFQFFVLDRADRTREDSSLRFRRVYKLPLRQVAGDFDKVVDRTEVIEVGELKVQHGTMAGVQCPSPEPWHT